MWIVDVSKGGTYVNRKKVKKDTKRILQYGDVISFLRPTYDGIGHEFKIQEPPIGLSIEPSYCSVNQHPNFMEKYEMRKLIGQGSYATVMEGVNKKTGEEVAIKVIERKKRFFVDPDKWQLQSNEIDIMKKIDHPNTVKMFDYYHTNDALYIVMELLTGGDLFNRIVDKGKYNENECKILIKNIVEAVQYLHKRSIVHRDLKPENILMKNNYSDVDIKIADFGVAKCVDDGCKTVVGSLSYIAPEVLKRSESIEGLGSYRESADLWSIGVITYVALTGSFPYKEERSMEMYKCMDKILNFKENCWQSISSDAKDFISRLFKIEPKDRMTTAECLQHPWIKNIDDKSKLDMDVTSNSLKRSRYSVDYNDGGENDNPNVENIKGKKRQL